MTMTEGTLPEIKIMRAVCASFPSGYCYCANHPYYTGHYPTKERATVAAAKIKRGMTAARKKSRRR